MRQNSPFQLSLITLFGVGTVIGPAPLASAAGFLIMLSFILADKYFHDSFHDKTQDDLAKFKNELSDLKHKQEQINAKLAFGANKNG